MSVRKIVLTLCISSLLMLSFLGTGSSADYSHEYGEEGGLGDMSPNPENDDQTYELTVVVDGDGEIIVDGMYVGDENTFNFEEGKNVSLNANPNDGWCFNEWSGASNSSDEEIHIVMDSNKAITGHFSRIESEYYNLTVNIEGEGSVKVNGETIENGESVNFVENQIVRTVATPDEHWSFVEWKEDHEGDIENTTLKVTGDMNITAVFEESTYSLMVFTNGKGSVSIDGEIVQDGDVIDIDAQDEVEIEAIPDDGWIFDEWSGESTMEDASSSFVVEEDTTIVAEFLEEEKDESLLPGFEIFLVIISIAIAVKIHDERSD